MKTGLDRLINDPALRRPLRGDKQDNMVESPDYQGPVHGIPVFSLYGEVRRQRGSLLVA